MMAIYANILVVIFNGWVSGFNVAMLATGNSTHPALTGALIVINSVAAIWIAKVTLDRAVALGAGQAPPR